MIDILQALRGAIEHEQALAGRYLPHYEPASPTDRAEARGDEPNGSPSPQLSDPPAADPPAADPPAADPSAAEPPASTEGAPVSDEAPPTTHASTSETTPDSMANTDLFGNEIDPAEDPSLSPYERIEALIPKDSPLHEMQSLDEVQEWATNTVLVPIDEARINAVVGVGNPEADLVIIGEAPGANEDKQGEPFVGRAGQLLDKILEAINFSRDDVYITNILKSRPPNNRDPLAEEVEAHLPILHKQLALIQPKLILCVGKTAGNSLLNRRSSLGSLRGTFHDYHGIPTMVTYHPAALLRNPQWKRPTWEDVKLLRTRYDQLVNG